MGIASLVLGIVSIIAALIPGVGLYIGIPTGVIAIVLGILGKKQEEPGPAGAGFITGIIGTALSIILYLACVACISAAGTSINKELKKNGTSWQRLGKDLNKSVDKLNKEIEKTK